MVVVNNLHLSTCMLMGGGGGREGSRGCGMVMR